MDTKNLSTLKIHKLTQAQYDRELAAGNIDEDALYLTQDDEYTNSDIDVILAGKADVVHTHDYLPITGGTLTGTLTANAHNIQVIGGNAKFYQERTDAGVCQLHLKNSVREGSFYLSGTGNIGIYDRGTSKWAMRSATDGKVYFPTAEVEITNGVRVGNTSATTAANVIVNNSKRNGMLSVSSSGALGIYDNTNGGWVMYSDTSKNVYFPSAATVQINNGLKVDGNFSALGSNSIISWTLMKGSGSVQLRRSGDSTSYQVSFAHTNSSGTVTFNHVYDKSGKFMLAPYYYILSYDRVTRAQMSSEDNLIPLKANGDSYNGKCCIGSPDNYWKDVYYNGALSKQSDRRVKNIIGDLSEENALDLLKGSEIKSFTYKTDEDNILHYGVIAQDVRDLLISSGIGYNSLLSIGVVGTGKSTTDVYMDEDKVRYSIDYTQYTPFLIKGWQNHETRLEALERENELLRNRIEVLENRAS